MAHRSGWESFVAEERRKAAELRRQGKHVTASTIERMADQFEANERSTKHDD
jgi:hypothetical protein